jgi:hypothetical protein
LRQTSSIGGCSHSGAGLAAAHHLRRSRWVNALPRDQHQHLAIGVTQRRKCREDPRVHGVVNVRRILPLEAEPFEQRRLPADRSTLVGDDPLCAPEQPRQRIVWDFFQPSPGDHEHLADDVVGRGNDHSAPSVRAHRRRIF